ncbi:MAG: GNAT family N-acetyltransferase [Chloroflexi bacterium]|nr:GNAT family N-acetyltransferase [Chloroflexota bacterium]
MLLEGLSFRRYEPRDFDQVWRLHKVALEDVGADAGEGPWDDDLRAIEDAYLASGGDFLVGEYQGRVVAMGALRRMGPADAEVARMRVLPERQRRGIGRALLELLEASAAEMGIKHLRLDTTAMQRAAQRLYESSGYTKVGEGERLGFVVYWYEKSL